MSSSIEINKTGYSENEVVENWAAVYAKKTIAEHRENAELDHPDGSVTYDKLDGGIKSRLNSAESDAASALAIAKASAAENLSLSGDALDTAINANDTAQSAALDAEAATVRATEAVTISESAILTARSASSDAASAKAQVSEIADALPDKADVTYVDSELLKKQDKELEWQLIDEVTLAEDVDAYDKKFKGNIVGIKVKIIVPTDVQIAGGRLLCWGTGGWMQSYRVSAYSAGTANSKIISCSWILIHGECKSDYCTVRTGANSAQTAVLYDNSEDILTTSNLPRLQYDGKLYTGTTIKVWGLIK